MLEKTADAAKMHLKTSSQGADLLKSIHTYTPITPIYHNFKLMILDLICNELPPKMLQLETKLFSTFAAAAAILNFSNCFSARLVSLGGKMAENLRKILLQNYWGQIRYFE